MEASPLVSICIPTYNHASLIHRAILSSINQSYKNIEIIIVDNKSSDNTKEIVLEYAKKDPRIKFFENESNIGSGRNFLRCFEHASGEFVQVLSDDDWISENCVEIGLEQIDKNPQVAAVLPDVIALKFESSDKFSFLDAWEINSGVYSSDWFFKKIAHGEIGGVGFISLMRKNDVVKALESVLKNPAHMVQRGERIEPFDMPIFLEVLVHYKHFIIDKRITYIKTIHGKDHVGLQGNFENLEGAVKYALLTRKSFEFFFKGHGLKKHFEQVRIWNGLSILARSIIARLQRRNVYQRSLYKKAVQDFFRDYSKKEKVLIFLSSPFYLILRGVNRFKRIFSKNIFAFKNGLFLTKELTFRTK